MKTTNRQAAGRPDFACALRLHDAAKRKVLDECKSYGKALGAHDPATYDPRPPRGPTAAANSASPGARRKTSRLICSPEDERRSPITQVFDLPVLFFAAIHQFEQAIGAPHI
jgi:hypothetical protein